MNIILKENETMQTLVDRLAASFELVYSIAPVAYWYENLYENGRIRDIHFSKRMREILGYKSVEEFPDELNTLMTFTHPDDVHIMLDDAIRAGTGEIDRYDVRYRIRKADGTYLWCNATGELVKDCNGVTVGMYGAFIDINEEIELQIRQKAEQEQRDALNMVLGDDGVFLIDCVNDTRRTIHDRLSGNAYYSDSEKYSEAFRRYVDTFVAPSDRGMMSEFASPDGFLERLADRNGFTVQYRDLTTGIQRFYEMRVVRFSDTEILQSFRENDRAIVEQLVFDELKNSYYAFFVVDLDAGLVEILKNSVLDRLGNERDVMTYARLMGMLAESSVDGLKAWFEKVSDIEYLKRRFANENHASFMYKSQLGDGGRWARADGIVLKRHENGVPSIFAFGFSYLDEDLSKIQDIQARLGEALNKANIEAQRNDLIMATFNARRWSYGIGPDDRVVSAHYSRETRERFVTGHSEDPMAWVGILHPEDRDRALAAFMAAIRDHSGRTPYEVYFRARSADGTYRWMKSAGKVIRRDDGSGDFIGMNLDITSQMDEQQKRLLGAMPLSNDVLAKAKIGMWAFELDEGRPPRMYDDETMLGLVGLDRQVPPEEAYHAWYDNIDEGSYDLVNDAVAKMMDGEHAEVQYPWHYPDGRTIIVRCGGVRNFEYTKGIRIEGTHQDVTRTLHFDEEERRRAKQLEKDLVMEKLRADSLAFIEDNEPDLDSAINFFGNRILEISGCDQVVYREMGGRKIVLNAPGYEEVPESICSVCPFARFDCEAFRKDGTVMMDDCRLGFNGITVPAGCPAKSSFMQMVYSGGEIVGKLTVHYLNDYHSFTGDGIEAMKTVAIYLGLMIGRIKEKQAEIARREAELSNKAKTEFLFNMSHDIRTPMNAIIGFTNMAIKNKNDPEVFEESLAKVRSSSEYLLRIVNDILDMAKIESGKLELYPELHFGNKGSNPLIEVFGAEAARKGIEFHTDYDVRDKYFWIDENRANQIVANLISNAIKYTEPGGDIWYSVRQQPCDREGYGKYTVSVEDTGRGMSREFLGRIFDAFERDESAIRSGEQGTGLGMAIVKKLVDAMGATIDVQSEPGKGTKVSFTAMHRLATPEEIAAHMSAEHGAADESIDFSGRKVLLVEDNELNREIATDILEEEGLTVDSADDGTTAVEKLKETGPDYYDFILMDIQMPVMNGYEATREIRRMYPGAALPIIALSANAFEEDKQKSLEAGMDGHVAKPINIRELFGALKSFM